MRPKHYLKNGLIFVPLIFSGELFDSVNIINALLAFGAFSAVASIVYIINDIKDIEKDKLHPKKKHRPLASGAVKSREAILLAIGLVIIASILAYIAGITLTGWLILVIYLGINVAYSFGLKHIPIIDVGILATGFVLRVLFGAEIVDIEISRWLYLTVLAGAFYLSLGKRRNEIMTNGIKSRKVNQYYSINFLDKNMYVCLALTLVFYSLWATDPNQSAASLFWTIPVIILLMMTYSLNIEKDGSMGDPVEVLLGDKVLATFAVTYVLLTTYLLYV